jgi:hypothetical protein
MAWLQYTYHFFYRALTNDKPLLSTSINFGLELLTLKNICCILQHYGSTRNSGSLFVYTLSNTLSTFMSTITIAQSEDLQHLLIEKCILCEASIVLPAVNPSVGAFYIQQDYSECTECGIVIERCCATFQLISSAFQKSSLYQCPCCKSVINSTKLNLVRFNVYAIIPPYSSSSEFCILCPFCSILMIHIWICLIIISLKIVMSAFAFVYLLILVIRNLCNSSWIF